LLRWLDREARNAGAEIVGNASFLERGCGTPGQGAAEIRFGDRKQSIGYEFLVGCDGARSRVAESFGLGRNREFLSGVELEFEGVRDLDEDCLHVFIDTDLARGYIAWVVPGVRVTQVGLAVRRPGVPRPRDLVAKVSRLFDFDTAKLVSRRGGLIPCGGVVTPRIGEKVMLIGDAAGMVSPLTAGGIHTAMDMGRAAGVALSSQLLDAEPYALAELERQVPSYFFKQLLRRGFDLPVPNCVYQRLLESRLFRAAAQNIFFHHRGLFSLRAWRDMLWNAQGRATLLGP
jgi:flavin-dependent dehydrogenase